MSNSYIVKLERIRTQLRDILRGKGKIVTDNETLDNLVPVVSTIGINSTIAKYLAGIEVFDVIDNDGEILTVASSRFKNLKVQNVKIPAVTYLGTDCFRSSQLRQIELATNNNDTLCTADGACFYDCVYLQTLIGGKVHIGNEAINGCTSLVKIKCENLTFGTYALRGLTNLKIIDFGTTPALSSSGGYGMNSSPSFKAIVLRNESMTTFGMSTTFTYLANNVTGWYIYVPDELVDTYKADSSWSAYSTYFKPLSEYNEESILNYA